MQVDGCRSIIGIVPGANGGYALEICGASMEIQGVYGTTNSLDVLSAIGGNILRLPSVSTLATNPGILDQAYALGLRVIIPLGAPQDGASFSYNSGSMAELSARQAALSLVSQYMNHPAVLMWCLGDTMDLNAANAPILDLNRVFIALDSWTVSIKQVDSSHPVMLTVTTNALSFAAKTVQTESFR